MKKWNRRQVLQVLSAAPAFIACSDFRKSSNRPNILLLMSDNHSWNHLGCYGDPVVQTPNIDAIANQGIRFTRAFCAAPSCSPARAGLLTGQNIWRLEEGANLWGILPAKFPIYTDLLKESGYHVGSTGKGWGPGSVADSGRKTNHGGKKYNSFAEFIEANHSNQPWCFWYSTKDPHRPYKVGSGKASGMDLRRVQVPKYLPDNDIVRGDMCDYYYEIQRFDQQVGEILNIFRGSGQYNNTLIVICSDNGWQMPRGLANLYDFGTRVPLIMSWKGQIPAGRTVDDFVSLNDLAPTFLELADLPVPQDMTAKSLTNLLFSEGSGRIDEDRNYIVTARERHAFCRQNGLGYPARAIRTYDYLYIRNYEPDRWPAGDPPLFGDVDAHMLHYPSPTKMFILVNKNRADVSKFYELGFARRPAEELYDLENDTFQMNNVAYEDAYKDIKQKLSRLLADYLTETKDPRILGNDLKWENGTYYQTVDFKPRPNNDAINRLGLKEEYNYLE